MPFSTRRTRSPPDCKWFLPDIVEIIVDRQKDLAAEFSKAMGKAKGGVIIILFDGSRASEEGGADSLVVSNFSITIGTKPVLRSNDPPADDVARAGQKRVHGWKHGALGLPPCPAEPWPQKRNRKISEGKGLQLAPCEGFAVGIVEKILIFSNDLGFGLSEEGTRMLNGGSKKFKAGRAAHGDASPN